MKLIVARIVYKVTHSLGEMTIVNYPFKILKVKYAFHVLRSKFDSFSVQYPWKENNPQQQSCVDSNVKSIAHAVAVPVDIQSRLLNSVRDRFVSQRQRG